MRITLLAKLVFFVSFGAARMATPRINLNDFLHGNYDLDMLAERVEDLKEVLRDPASAGYPYTECNVRENIKIILRQVEMVEESLSRWRFLTGGSKMKLSDLFLEGYIDVDATLESLRVGRASLIAARRESPYWCAAMKRLTETVIRGSAKYMDQLREIKWKKDNRDMWARKYRARGTSQTTITVYMSFCTLLVILGVVFCFRKT